MKAVCWLMSLSLICIDSFAQDVAKKLLESTKRFESDSQMRHAIYSLYVIDAKTGKVVFDKNSQIGLAPASCQKLFTSGAAFELLGADFTYKTQIQFEKWIWDGPSAADMVIIASGDPTFGSWRFASTKENVIIAKCVNEIMKRGFKQINLMIGAQRGWFNPSIPGGWIWDDIGNYYGAGAEAFNWRENQYDLILSSGDKVGDTVKIVGTIPEFVELNFNSEVRTAEKGSGDNAYIYLPVNATYATVRGTIPVGEKSFVISGSLPNPDTTFIQSLSKELQPAHVKINAPNDLKYTLRGYDKPEVVGITSPTLDSMNYWFLRRSINLYGEALVKTIAFEMTTEASTEKGVEVVRDFWSKQGIDKAAINIIDGSGLSPQNRVTTNALVTVLKYAKTRPWYNSFYLSLPTYNGMKMKSGSIGGARSFAGYHTSKGGHEYIFAIIVNNYDGSSGAIVNKMYKVLDNLK